jgi:hypothetical protein
MSHWSIIEADVVEALRGMESDSMDAALLDPPYGLGSKAPTVPEIVAFLTADAAFAGRDFMNKNWQIPPVAFWRELCRVLKPGAHVLAFAGTRTLDLIMLGIRAGGFEIRDSIGCAMPSEGPGILSWCYASGFPKSLDVSRAIDDANGDEREIVSETVGRWKYANGEKSGAAYGDESRATDEDGYLISKTTAPASDASAAFAGYGTALAPAWEPIVLARKPLDGTVARTALSYGTGGLAIDASRVKTSDNLNGGTYYGDRRATEEPDTVTGARPLQRLANGCGRQFVEPEGRFPKNVLLVHDPRCVRTGTKRVRSPNGSADYTLTGVDGPPIITRNVKTGAHHGDADGLAEYSCVPTCPCAILDAQSGERPGMSGGGTHREGYQGGMFGGIDSTDTARGDDGAASRFYAQFQYTEADRFQFVAKASRSEREFGCEDLPAHTAREAVGRDPDSVGARNARAGAGRGAGTTQERCAKCGESMTGGGGRQAAARNAPCEGGGSHEPVVTGEQSGIRNIGPCVKPITLTRYLAALIKPPVRTDGAPLRIVIPYAGTGSEMIGALRAGWDEAIGIQRTADKDERAYVAIAKARLARWDDVPAAMDEAEAVRESRTQLKAVDPRQASLFEVAK